MDWWLFMARSLVKGSKKDSKVNCFFLASVRTQMMMARTATVLWANTVHKCQDVILTKIKANIGIVSMLEICSDLVCYSVELFPSSVVARVTERFSRVLHDECV